MDYLERSTIDSNCLKTSFQDRIHVSTSMLAAASAAANAVVNQLPYGNQHRNGQRQEEITAEAIALTAQALGGRTDAQQSHAVTSIEIVQCPFTLPTLVKDNVENRPPFEFW